MASGHPAAGGAGGGLRIDVHVTFSASGVEGLVTPRGGRGSVVLPSRRAGLGALKQAIRGMRSVKDAFQELEREGLEVDMRLLHRGQRVSGSTLSDVVDGDVVHCVTAVSHPRNPARREGGREAGVANTGSTGLEGQLTRGFDRLLDMGFSRDDVAAVREQFRASVAGPEGGGGAGGGDAMAVEDAWFDDHRNDRYHGGEDPSAAAAAAADGGEAITLVVDPRASRSDVCQELLLGCVLGFFLGVASLALASTHAWRNYGVKAGLLVNLYMGYVAYGTVNS